MVIRIPYGGRHRRGRAPLRLVRGLLRPHPGPAGRHPGHARRRLLAAAAGHRLPRPGHLPRAQEAATGRRQTTVLDHTTSADRPGRRAPAGHRRHPDRLRRHGARPRWTPPTRPQQEGRSARGHRPAQPVPVRRRDRRRLGPADRPGRRGPRGQRFCGYGAEVAARLPERCFHYLDAPVLRVTGFDIPYPPPHLEQHHLPSVDRDPGRDRPAPVGPRPRHHEGGRLDAARSCCRTSERA